MMEHRLGDLHQVGRPHTLTGPVRDENGNVLTERGEPKIFEIEVWIQKLSGPDHDAATRRANAAKARHLACREDTESDNYQAALNDVLEVAGTRELLIEYAIADKVIQQRPMFEYSVAFERAADNKETEWEKDGYLQGLYDQWRGDPDDPDDLGLMQQWAADPDDPDAAGVLAEITRFLAEVEVRLNHFRDDLRASYEDTPIEDIQAKIVEQFIESTAATVWIEEFRRHRAYLSTRVSRQKRSERYFKSRAEVDDLHDDTFKDLVAVYEERLAVDPTEGKGLAATTSSSPQSAPPAAQEDSPSSGPATANP